MVPVLFYSFTAIILCVITIVAWKYAKPEKKKKVLLFPLVIVVFQITIAIVGSTGFYINFGLPPRMVYAGIVPAFILLALFSFSKTGKELLLSVPSHYPVVFQSFRIIVELFIYWTFLLGWGPKEATMIGYNYEFYFVIFALVFGFLYLKNKLSNRVILIWNFLGLALLAFIVGIFFTSAFAWDSFWERSTPMMTSEMMTMPVLSIATLYMPIAVWMHIFSIRQMIHSKS